MHTLYTTNTKHTIHTRHTVHTIHTIHYTTLQYIILHYNTIHYSTLYYITILTFKSRLILFSNYHVGFLCHLEPRLSLGFHLRYKQEKYQQRK